MIQEFLGWLRAHGGRRYKDRKTGQLAGAGCSDQIYNRYKSYLSTIFKFGIRCGYNTINPVELIEAAPVVVETYEGFHEDQLALLLTHCPRIVVPSEASKNRVPRTIRMTKRVEALLREIMENGLV